MGEVAPASAMLILPQKHYLIFYMGEVAPASAMLILPQRHYLIPMYGIVMEILVTTPIYSYHEGMTTEEVVRSKEDQSLAMIVPDLNVDMEYTYDV